MTNREDNKTFEQKGKIIKEGVFSLKEGSKKAPKLYGVRTGVDGLDKLFFFSEIDEETGKPVKKILGGYPAYSVVNITGVSDTGKSLMAEQFAVVQASEGKAVGFVTVESPAAFVVNSLKQRARAMGVDPSLIEEQIFFIDVASHYVLREDLTSFFNTLAYAIKEYNISRVVVDSITGFYEEKEMMARAVVRRFFNFMKKWHQTAIFISQKRSGHEELSAEAAGGYAISHIVDCSIVLSKVPILTAYQQRMYKKPIGELVRLFRIDGCRLCGHDTRVYLMDITEEGLVKIVKPLEELL